MNRHWTGSYLFSLKSNCVLCTSDTNAPASFVVLWWIHSKKKKHLRNTINQMIGGYSVDFFFYRCLQCLKCSFMAWCSCYECHIIFWCVFLRTFSPHLYISCEITYIYLIWVKLVSTNNIHFPTRKESNINYITAIACNGSFLYIIM